MTALCTSFTSDGLHQIAIARSHFSLACIATVDAYNARTEIVGTEKAKVPGDKILNATGAAINTLSRESQDTLVAEIKEGRLSICLLIDDVDKRITGIQVMAL